MHLGPGLVTLFLATATCVFADEPALSRFEFEQIRFAAPARLSFYAPSEALANQVSKQVFDRLKSLDRIMSDYDPDSELSQLCEKSGPGRPIHVGDELWSILQSANDFSQKTDGAFDVSVGPVVRLWRTSRRSRTLPAPDAVREALAKVDWKSIVLDENQHTVELRRPAMQIDLGGIAQGYAADEAFRILKDAGITRALVDISGDIRLGDPPPGRTGWRIAVQALESHGATPEADHHSTPEPRMLVIANSAVSTSGDAYQYVEIEGVRYSHIVDPATGLGLKRSSSVTIIAPDAISADALATAVSVQGPQKGLETIQKIDGAEALFAWLDDEGQLQSSETAGFARYENNLDAGPRDPRE